MFALFIRNNSTHSRCHHIKRFPVVSFVCAACIIVAEPHRADNGFVESAPMLVTDAMRGGAVVVIRFHAYEYIIETIPFAEMATMPVVYRLMRCCVHAWFLALVPAFGLLASGCKDAHIQCTLACLVPYIQYAALVLSRLHVVFC